MLEKPQRSQRLVNHVPRRVVAPSTQSLGRFGDRLGNRCFRKLATGENAFKKPFGPAVHG